MAMYLGLKTNRFLVPCLFIEIGVAKNKTYGTKNKAEVCADYTCSLYRLQLKSPESTTYLQI